MMIETKPISADDLGETSTENLCKALAIIPAHRTKVQEQSEIDIATPMDEDRRSDLLAINNYFIRLWDQNEAILKAELKKRLH